MIGKTTKLVNTTEESKNCSYIYDPDRKELIKIISTRYLLISLISRKYLVDMILINLSGRDINSVFSNSVRIFDSSKNRQKKTKRAGPGNK
jgi:hypothetical protein